MNFTLRQLRSFEALVRHGHFGHAAEAVAISQPALSVQIRDLEHALGGPLFERGARMVRLTPLGEAARGRVRAILRGADELGDLGRASGWEGGVLRLGVIPTVAPYLLPAVIARLGADHPGLELEIRETITPRLIDALADGRIDAAIVALPLSEPAMVEVPLVKERFVLVRPRADAGRPVPRAAQLAEMRLLLLEEGHCFREQALAFCAMRPGRRGMDGSSLTTLVQMVGAGLGVTLIPEMAIAIETRSAPVAIGRFPDPQPARTVGLAWRRTTPLSSRLEEVAAAIRSAAAA